MKGEGIAAVVAIVTGIIGLAALGVILSRQSNTAGVLQAAGTSLSSLIKAATGGGGNSF